MRHNFWYEKRFGKLFAVFKVGKGGVVLMGEKQHSITKKNIVFRMECVYYILC